MSDLPLIEPFPIADEFYSGLARIQDLGNCARFVLYTEDVRYEDGESPIFVVSKKIVLPHKAVGPGIDMATQYMARRAVRIAGSHLLRLVKV